MKAGNAQGVPLRLIGGEADVFWEVSEYEILDGDKIGFRVFDGQSYFSEAEGLSALKAMRRQHPGRAIFLVKYVGSRVKEPIEKKGR